MKKKDELEKQTFFDLMQAYRTMPVSEQDWVIEAFDKVKDFIRSYSRQQVRETLYSYKQELKKKVEALRVTRFEDSRLTNTVLDNIIKLLEE